MTGWSEDIAGSLAREALGAVGVVDSEIRLVRFRKSFATFRVERPPLQVKVGSSESDGAILERSLKLGRTLRDAGVPVATPADEVASGPVRVGDRWAGLWRWEETRPGRPDAAATGAGLRQLHESLATAEITFPKLDPIDPTRERLAQVRRSGVLPAAALDFLDGRLDWLKERWEAFDSRLGVGPIHGDFKLANVLTTQTGPLIMDLDDVCVAPREWDLATISRSAHDGWSADEWPAFSSGYGYDLLAHAQTEPLRRLTHFGALVFQLARAHSPQRVRRGQALVDQWLRNPQRGCHELDWEGVFRRFPDPAGVGS